VTCNNQGSQRVAHMAQDVLKFAFCAGVAQAGRAADL
jgi:hypothetical protein